MLFSSYNPELPKLGSILGSRREPAEMFVELLVQYGRIVSEMLYLSNIANIGSSGSSSIMISTVKPQLEILPGAVVYVPGP